MQKAIQSLVELAYLVLIVCVYQNHGEYDLLVANTLVVIPITSSTTKFILIYAYFDVDKSVSAVNKSFIRSVLPITSVHVYVYMFTC